MRGRIFMSRRAVTGMVVAGAFLVVFLLRSMPGLMQGDESKQAKDQRRSDEQVTGPYEVIKHWPKPLPTLFPEEKGWTWGSTQAVFDQNPNRISISMRGEFPIITTGGEAAAPVNIDWPEAGETARPIFLTLPTPGLPVRATSIGPTTSPGEPHVKFVARENVDYRRKHLIFAVDSQGNLVDDWSRWDRTFKRVHRTLISPYDQEKRIWVDDDGRCAIFLSATTGSGFCRPSARPMSAVLMKRFNRQTDIAWLSDGSFFVTDGYENTRVVKLDKNGNYLTAWGKPSWDWKTRKDVPGLPIDENGKFLTCGIWASMRQRTTCS
jgi:hypothetical protein